MVHGMRKKEKTISFRVERDVYDKWRELDTYTKREIRFLFETLVRSRGMMPVQIQSNKYILVSGKKLKQVKHYIEEILKKSEIGVLSRPPQWIINDLRKLLELIE